MDGRAVDDRPSLGSHLDGLSAGIAEVKVVIPVVSAAVRFAVAGDAHEHRLGLFIRSGLGFDRPGHLGDDRCGGDLVICRAVAVDQPVSKRPGPQRHDIVPPAGGYLDVIPPLRRTERASRRRSGQKRLALANAILGTIRDGQVTGVVGSVNPDGSRPIGRLRATSRTFAAPLRGPDRRISGRGCNSRRLHFTTNC